MATKILPVSFENGITPDDLERLAEWLELLATELRQALATLRAARGAES